MQRNAAAVALLALAWTLLCPQVLAAEPTRTLARPASRLLTVQPNVHASRERAARTPVRERATYRGEEREAHNRSKGRRAPADRQPESRKALATASRASRRSNNGLRVRASIDRVADAPADSATARRVHAWEKSRRDAAARASIAAADRAATHPAPTMRPASAEDVPAGDDLLAGNAPEPFPATRIKSIEEEAATPVLMPALRVSSLYDSRGRLVVPKPLYGSHQILIHQNQMADRDGLNRIHDDTDLIDLLRGKKLVALPAGDALQIDERLPDNRRYSRPWTAAFLTVLSHDFYASFHQPLQVTSAVRTVEVQQRLVRTNGNAAPVSGESASPHLTGQAVDIAKHGLSMTEIAWMRTYLAPLIDAGKIDVEEEFRQSCFHISVYKNFVPAVSHVTVAASRTLATPTAP